MRPLVVGLLVGLAATQVGCRSAGRRLPSLFSGGSVSRLAAEAASPDPDLRREAALTLGRRRLRGEQAENVRDLLAELLRGDPEPLVRSAAAVSLGRQGGEPSVPVLIERQADASPLVRADVCRALGMTGVAEAKAPLKRALAEDADVDVRCAAARALGGFSDADARQALLEALDAERLAVQTAAHEALVKSTGAKKVPPQRDAWEQWLAGHADEQPRRRRFLFW